MTSGTTTAEYSESESAKKANVLIPIENKYQDDLKDDDSEEDSELEPEFSYGYRGRQVLDASGDKTDEGLVRPPKKVKNQGNGEKAGEGAENGK